MRRVNDGVPVLNISDISLLKQDPKKYYEEKYGLDLAKTHYTIAQQQEAWAGWSSKERYALLKYGLPDFSDEEYERVLSEAETVQDLWEYEKRVFKEVPKKKRENIVEFLTDFDENDYQTDKQLDIPTEGDFQEFLHEAIEMEMEEADSPDRYQDLLAESKSSYIDPDSFDWVGYASGEWELGPVEKKQMDLQDRHWSILREDGFDYKTRREYLNVYFDEDLMDGSVYPKMKDSLGNVIDNNVALAEDTKFYTTSLDVDENSSVGKIVTSAEDYGMMHYNKESATTGGIEDIASEPYGEYTFEVCVPSGTKGMNTSNAYAEHQYITDKKYDYIIYEIDHQTKTGKAKLIER